MCCICSDAGLVVCLWAVSNPLPTPTLTHPFPGTPHPCHTEVVIFSVGDAARSARIRLHREINGAQEKEIEREHTCILATWQGELVGVSDGERVRENRWLAYGMESIRDSVGQGICHLLSFQSKEITHLKCISFLNVYSVLPWKPSLPLRRDCLVSSYKISGKGSTRSTRPLTPVPPSWIRPIFKCCPKAFLGWLFLEANLFTMIIMLDLLSLTKKNWLSLSASLFLP